MRNINGLLNFDARDEYEQIFEEYQRGKFVETKFPVIHYKP